MTAKWIRIEGKKNQMRTEAMLVPGGMVLRTKSRCLWHLSNFKRCRP